MPSIVVADTIVAAQHITRDYSSDSGTLHALRGISMTIQPGEFVALRGRSGSGKTTLLNILTGLDNPTSGEVIVLGQSLSKMRENERVRLRRESIGMMFQNAHLFPVLTALENVEIPLRLSYTSTTQRIKRAKEALEQVGLGQRFKHRGMELSGGEQQRVALARALVHQPRFLVADEPTGNLDSMTGSDIVQLLQDLAHETQIGMLIATHDPLVFGSADRILYIQDGLVHDDNPLD